MPIYDYACADCGAGFEQLVRSDTEVTCPRCESARVERRLSLTARPASAGQGGPDLGRLGPPPGGGCCGGGCGHAH